MSSFVLYIVYPPATPLGIIDISFSGSQLFKNLPSNLPEFYKQIVSDYKEIPVFSKYDMDSLYDKLVLTPNYDIYNIINMVQERYKENKELLKTDSKNLKKLSDIIKKQKSPKDRTIKYALLDNLSSIIDKITKTI